MGFKDIPTSNMKIMGSNITLKSKLMYTRDDMLLFLKMLERGLLAKGKEFVDTKAFGLDDFKEVFNVAAEHTGLGESVVVTP